jgi:hypothetical protein
MSDDQSNGTADTLTRRSPCPCGSGRRYARCHGTGRLRGLPIPQTAIRPRPAPGAKRSARPCPLCSEDRGELCACPCASSCADTVREAVACLCFRHAANPDRRASVVAAFRRCAGQGCHC